jgi:hypothetical protein
MRPVTYSWLAVVLGIACAAIGWLGIVGWLATAILLASIAAHVAGNALGTRLREATDHDLVRLGGSRPARPTPPPRLPPTPLQRRTSLGSLVPVSAIIGGGCGGLVGAIALFAWAGSSPAGALLGGVSSAVVGGLFGFLAASFVQIVRTSLREAIAAERAAAERH